MKKIAGWTGAIIILSLIGGCASVQSSGEVVRGRRVLLGGEPDEALAYFRRAADVNPDYVTGFTVFKEGVWTYVGRAYYELKNYAEARRALETAVQRHNDDAMAHLYLGLTLAREGDRQRGLREIQMGLKGLYEWLESVATLHRYDYGQFWDPTRAIRSQIQATLAMATSEQLDGSRLLSDAERIGRRMEEEIDRAAQEERFFRGRPGDNDRGGGRR